MARPAAGPPPTHNRASWGEPRSGGGLSLTLLEAVYLVETERLAVTRGGEPLPTPAPPRAPPSAHDQFEIKYGVYRDRRQRGYVAVEGPGLPDFHVFPRGGAPGRTPAKFWVL